MKQQRSLPARAAFFAALLLAALFVALCLYSAVRTNRRKLDQPVEVHPMGETVELGGNFFADAAENPDGYAITVNSAELVEYGPFLESLGASPEDFGYTGGYTAPPYTYLLHVTVSNTGNEEGALMTIHYALYHGALKIPVDYSLWGLLDEHFTGEMGFRLRPDSTVDITIPFTPMPLDASAAPAALAQRMEEETFLFCVSEFPLRKAIAVRQGG